MRMLLAAMLVGHGLIHLIGFSAAFGLGDPGALRADPSRLAGALWLLATGLLVTSGVLVVTGPGRWWPVALVALVLSQGLIVSAWSDAKFGTVANVAIAIPVLLAFFGQAPWSPAARYARDVAAESSHAVLPPDPVTEADLVPLPDVVRSYLRFSGAIGRPGVVDYAVRFTGSLRNGPADAWMACEVEQWSTHAPSTRRFLVRAARFGIPFVAFHRYVGGAATFEVHLASLIRVVAAKGPEMDQSETVTLLNDMALLAPATLIDPRIRWEVVDDRTVRAVFTNEGHAVSATLAFDASGALVNFWSDDRYQTGDGKAYRKARWSTPVSAYRDVGGHQVPVQAEARWRIADGEFAYARFDIVDIAYNTRVRQGDARETGER